MSERSRTIVLIGFMGAGKTALGHLLQKRIGLPRFDTDEIVTTKSGLSIPEIFAQHSEEKFREMETNALREIPQAELAIVVTGGGIVLRKENVDFLKQLGVIVWLDANEETLFERASRKGDRPLLQTGNPQARFSDLLRKRMPFYAKLADIRIDTSALTPDEAADAILREIEKWQAKR